MHKLTYGLEKNQEEEKQDRGKKSSGEIYDHLLIFNVPSCFIKCEVIFGIDLIIP